MGGALVKSITVLLPCFFIDKVRIVKSYNKLLLLLSLHVYMRACMYIYKLWVDLTSEVFWSELTILSLAFCALTIITCLTGSMG